MKLQSWVHVRSIKKPGQIVEKLKNGSYRVACGSMILVRPAADLEAIPPDKWTKYKHLGPKKFSAPQADEKAKESIDLHGMRVEEALKLVEQFLDRAIMGDLHKVEIIHGVGTGRLLHAVHQYLKKLSAVKNFKLDENNAGTTVVYF